MRNELEVLRRMLKDAFDEKNLVVTVDCVRCATEFTQETGKAKDFVNNCGTVYRVYNKYIDNTEIVPNVIWELVEATLALTEHDQLNDLSIEQLRMLDSKLSFISTWFMKVSTI